MEQHTAATVPERGITPLHAACEGGHLDTVKFFVSHGAKLGARTSSGATPLLRAACSGHLSIVKFLWEGIPSSKRRNAAIREQLRKDSQNGAVKELQDKDGDDVVDVDAMTTLKATPVYFAVLKGHVEVARYLIEVCGATADVSFCDGMRLVHVACVGGSVEMLKYLLKSGVGTVAELDDFGTTPLYHAVVHGNTEVLRALFNYEMESRVEAVKRTCDPEKLRRSPNMSTDHKEIASKGRGGLEVDKSDNANAKEKVEMPEILKNIPAVGETLGIEVRSPRSGMTVLHVAASKGDYVCAHFLLELLDANLQATTKFNGKEADALMIAAECGHAKTVSVIIAAHRYKMKYHR